MRVALVSIAAVSAMLVFLMPLLWLISSSFRRPGEQFSVDGLGIPWIDFTPSANAWGEQVNDPVVLDALGRSTVIAFAAMAIAVLLGVPAAWGLAGQARRGNRRRSDLITGLLLAARVVPPIAMVIPLYLLMDWAGLIDTLMSLILVNAALVLPFIVIIMRQTFLDLPRELEEAAIVDGAPSRVILLRIILPVSTPALAASALIALAYVWNDYIFALAFFRLDVRTMPMLITGGTSSAGMMVRALIAIAVPAIVALVAQRYIVRGLTFGALGK